MLISFFNINNEYKIYKHFDLYFTSHQLKFSKLVWEVNIWYVAFVKYALINFRSPYQYTISIDLLSIKISIRIISIRIGKQSKHRDQQAKGQTELALSCFKKYALFCMQKNPTFFIFTTFSLIYDLSFYLIYTYLHLVLVAATTQENSQCIR